MDGIRQQDQEVKGACPPEAGTALSSSGLSPVPGLAADALQSAGAVAHVVFCQTDAGRALSRRPRQKNDCTVRAYALATGTPYDEAYDEIAAAGRKCARGFNFRKFSAEKGFQWTPFPAVKGERRMNPYRFAAEHPVGTYVLRTAKHVFAVIDGTILDTIAPPVGRCVYGAWSIKGQQP